MTQDRKQQPERKRLLVASVGVATVSFMSLHSGCEDRGIVNVANLLAVPLDSSIDPALTRDAATDASSRPDALFPSANLLAVPVDSGSADAADGACVGSEDAMPPADGSTDAATDATAHEAEVETGLRGDEDASPPAQPDGSCR